MDRARWLHIISSGLQAASTHLQHTSRALREFHPVIPNRKPLAKLRLICLGCRRQDHQDCSGILFLRAGKNRRQPCGCRCREIKAKSA